MDANYTFIWADVRGNGSASDAQIYNESELKENQEKVTLGLPDLPNDNEPTPYYFIGDDAFGLREHLLKLYSLRGLTQDERIFNYRLSRSVGVSSVLCCRTDLFCGTAVFLPRLGIS